MAYVEEHDLCVSRSGGWTVRTEKPFFIVTGKSFAETVTAYKEGLGMRPDNLAKLEHGKPYLIPMGPDNVRVIWDVNAMCFWVADAWPARAIPLWDVESVTPR